MARWEPAPEPIDIGRWRVDPRADEITSAGDVMKLEPLKMRLLLALAERPGEVLLTQELLDRVWGDIVVTSASVYQGIAQLRRVLGDNTERPTYIETVPRKGYRLVAPVLRPAAAAMLPSAAPPPASQPATGEPDAAALLSAPRAGPARPAPRGGSSKVAEPHLLEMPVSPMTPASLPSPQPPLPAATLASHPGRRRWLLAGAAAIGIAGAGLAYRRWAVPPIERPVRLAVLPFADRTLGSTEAALAQGLALDVIRAFERYPDALVTAPESALRAFTPGRPLEELARQLRAAFVLLGDLLEAGTRVRVAVQLLALPAGRVLWQSEFERPSETVSTVPAAIAGEAASALRLPKAPPARSQGPTAAYELYVLGNHAWRPKTQEAFVKAREYYQRGIEIDPGYARNYLGVGWSWIGQATNGGGVEYGEAFARATPLFDKALRLDPESAEALTAQGVLRARSMKFDEARRLLDRAAALNPGYAQVHHSRGVAEFDDGWPQRAIPHFRRAAELNPLSLAPLDRLGVALVTSGRFAEADNVLLQAIALEPAHPNGYWGLGIKGYAEGALDAAVLGYREALQREARRPFLWSELSFLYLDLGAADAAADAMARCAELLPAARWPAVLAGYAWLIRSGERSQPPPSLALTADAVPEDAYAVDVMLIRAMAGLPLDERLLQRAIDLAGSLDTIAEPILWLVFQGHHVQIALATVYAALGQPERAAPLLERAERQLSRYEQRGNVWHALSFHRALIHALRGRSAEALDALDAAAAAGCRRSWRLRLDPAFASVRESARFAAALDRMEAENGRQRQRLGL